MWRTHRGTLDETCVEVEVDSQDVDGTVQDVDGAVQGVDGTVQDVDGSDAGFPLQTRRALRPPHQNDRKTGALSPVVGPTIVAAGATLPFAPAA